MSAIIISGLLMFLVMGLVPGSFYLSSEATDFENRQQSLYLAWSCFETARSGLILNAGPPKLGDVAVGKDVCNISSISFVGDSAIVVQTGAKYKNSAANLRIIINAKDWSLASWQDLDSIN